MQLESGHKVIQVSKEEDDIQKKMFLAYANGVIKLEPGNWFFPSQFQTYANEIYNYKFRPTDIVVMTYPKCGTAWIQEIVWTMRNNPNLDSPLGLADAIFRIPFMEADFIMSTPHLSPLPISEEISREKTGSTDIKRFFINYARNAPDPRTIKTHLPFSLLQKNLLDICKVVYVMRHPKDICVSYHHHSRMLKAHDFTGTFDEFVDLFINEKLMNSPLWGMYEEAWEKRNHSNLCIIFYEKLLSDTKGELRRLNKFLGTNLTETQIGNVVSHTKFSNMKSRSENISDMPTDQYVNKDIADSDGGMFRKGISGDWKTKLNDDQIKKFDEWINYHAQLLGGNFKELSMYCRK